MISSSLFFTAVATVVQLLLLATTPTMAGDIIPLTPQQFYDGIITNSFDAIIDTRTAKEWSQGHIPNATFLDSLHLYGTDDAIANPHESLMGCTECRIVLYCQSGGRAFQAGEMLIAEGFNGPIYNGLGMKQWVMEDLPIDFDGPSVDAPCACEECVSKQCRNTEVVVSDGEGEEDTTTTEEEVGGGGGATEEKLLRSASAAEGGGVSREQTRLGLVTMGGLFALGVVAMVSRKRNTRGGGGTRNNRGPTYSRVAGSGSN